MNSFLQSLAGEHIDSAHDYLTRICDELVAIREQLTPSPETLTRKTQRRVFAGADGTGTVVVDLGTVPSGATWEITRVAAQGSATTRARIWIDASTGGGTLIDKFALDADGDYADQVSENPVVSEGRRVLVEFLVQTANQHVSVWLQVEQFQTIEARKV